MHFMRSITRTLNLESGRSGRVFGSRYHWTLIDSEIYFAHALKYAYRNPVRAGICQRVEEYPYSTLHGLLGCRRLGFPIDFPFQLDGYIHIPPETEDQLDWLNRPFRVEQQAAIQKALKRTRFEPPKTGWRASLEELKKDLF